jgi:hypothetical protein
VAEEAARLVDALGGWASSHGYAAGSPPSPPSPSGADAAEDAAPAGCPTCGAEAGVRQAAACRLCPVCQGIGLLRSVRPETVDRLADLAGALAATLREVAASRRSATSAAETGAASTERQPSASRVQDILVEDPDAAP